MRRPIGPTDSSRIPRFAGEARFARLPALEEVPKADVVIAGMPFDAGASYRPGTRFGPGYIRECSRLLRPYHPGLGVSPFELVQVVDGGDFTLNPYDIGEALGAVRSHASALIKAGAGLVALGGDHSVTLPLLRAAAEQYGPVALVHIDAHLDTWDTYFGAEYTHGTTFRRAIEEGILDPSALAHVGIRGPLYSAQDVDDDAGFGFTTITSADVLRQGPDSIASGLRNLVGDRPLYLSVDIDSLDPAHAPGTGTPEAGGMTTRELLELLRCLRGLNLIGADLVEVSPPFDHAQITGIAAAHIVFDLVTLLAISRTEA